MNIKLISAGVISMLFSFSGHSQCRPNMIELYDLKNDPMEWKNLIRLNDKKALEAKAMLEQWIPKTSAPALPSNQVADSDKETDGKGESNDKFNKIRPLSKLK